ncbi:S-layer protein SlpA [Clostridioides difficile]
MNKKNIAIAMSGLTVLASAAPVFAAITEVTVDESYTTVQKDYKTTLKKIQEGILNKSITAIKVSYDGNLVSNFTVSGDLSVASTQFYNLVEPQLKNMDDGDLVEFAISYSMKNKTYSEKELNTIAETLSNQTVIRKATASSPGLVEQDTVDNTKVKAADKNLTAGDFYTFKISLVDPDDASKGYELEAIARTDNAEMLAKYRYAFTDTATDIWADAGVVSALKAGNVKITAGQVVDQSASFVVTPDSSGKTAKVADIVLNADAKFNKGTINVKVINATETTIDVDSKSSTSAEDLAKKYVFKDSELGKILDVLKTTKGYDDEFVQLVNGKYQTVIYPEGKRLTTKGGEETAPVKLIIKSDKVKDLKDYIDDLKTYNNSYSNVVTVAGEDRIETAIELSSKYYNSDDTHAISSEAVDSIVLVGSQAIVDGLVASPLASEKHAPLLLTSKDKLDSNLKSEIKRVMDLKSTTGINTTKKVYLAGGVNSISKDVENELKDMGLKVTRLAGDDRYETSLAIADEVGLDNDKAFVVGGTGLADAMSIAPVASQLKDSNGKLDATDGDATPIVVVDGKAKDINAATEDFLDNAQVDIIGGENSVSKDIEEAIDDATGKEPNRTSGDDRQATNAEVMKETDYFEKASVENYFVAKDGSTKEDQLVDALAAAPVAANFGSTYNGKTANGTVSPAPIVLATDSLSSDQNVGVSKSVKDDGGKNLVQVGQGIASSIINKMKDLLDM